MNIDKLKDIFNKDLDCYKSFLIDGSWGIGKSSFINTFLSKKSYIYLSLFGIKDSKDPDKAKISFLYKNGGSAGYSYYAKTLADHKPNTGLYLDFGADEKLDAKDMNEVVRIAKMYAGIADDPEDDYDDEAAIIRQTQELYDNGDIDEEEYERRMDFIL